MPKPNLTSVRPAARSRPCARRRAGIRFPALVAAFAALSALLLAACSGVPDAAPGRPAPPASAPAAASPERTLAALPSEAKTFMTELQARLRRGDWGWAAERADASFLRAMEGRGRDPYFYSYLFAAGILSRDSAEGYERFEALPMARVRNLAWDEGRVEGPVAVVRGRFLLDKGEDFPFVLRLLWRLDPPRILGLQP